MKKHMLFIICTEFFLLFVLSDIKCMAAFPEEAQAAEEKGALEGIPEEELVRITEAFYMVDKSRARAQGGAGLGLAVCKKIVDYKFQRFKK